MLVSVSATPKKKIENLKHKMEEEVRFCLPLELLRSDENTINLVFWNEIERLVNLLCYVVYATVI